MASYTTCRGCSLDKASCQKRKDVRTAIKMLGVTAIKFKCSLRKPLFECGDRVSVTWNIINPHDEGPYGQLIWEEHIWPATIIQEAYDGKYVILVDDVDSDEEMPAKEWIKNENLFCKVRASKLKLLDEARRGICSLCKEPFGNDGVCLSSYCLCNIKE